MFLKKQLLQNCSIGQFSLRERRGLVFLEKFQGGKVSNIENPEPPVLLYDELVDKDYPSI